MQDEERLVRDYLAAAEARDLEKAGQYLAEGADLLFPGGRRPGSLDEIVSNSGRRYRRIGKHIDGVDVCKQDGKSVAYCYGRLHGIWPDGESFDGIRFVDRFEIRDGKIVAQWVWNDSGEARLAKGDQSR